MIAGSMSGVAFCIEHSCRFDENVGLPGARSSANAEGTIGLLKATPSKLFSDRRRGFWIAPGRSIAAIAPGPWPVEGMDTELMQLGHLAHPARTHPVGMVVRRLAHLRQPQLSVERFGGNLLGALHSVELPHHITNAVAGKRELASKTPMGVLIDNPADRVRIFAGEHAVQHHLGNRDLTPHGLAAR